MTRRTLPERGSLEDPGWASAETKSQQLSNAGHSQQHEGQAKLAVAGFKRSWNKHQTCRNCRRPSLAG